MKLFKTLAAAIIPFALGATAAQATDLWVAEPGNDQLMDRMRPTPNPQHPPGDYSPKQSLAPLVSALQPAVVNIHVEQKVRHEMMPMMEFFSPFFGQQMPNGGDMPEFRVKTGQGSGFIISADGYLLTNNHVVADADKVTVKLSDDREFEGTVVGTDSRIDIALVKIDADVDLPYVAAGESGSMEVGDWVVAIGNPFGLTHTVTAGIVSAKGRVIGAGPYDDFIQTDASINPGNSGGPLFNLDGQVIGINTAINAAGQGIGFAVPMDMVTPFLDDLKEHGEIARGWLGVGLQRLDEDLAAGLNMNADAGVLIAEVHADQPGDKAGLLPGDVVKSINGVDVTDAKSLIRQVGKYRAGEDIELDLLRDGKGKLLTVELGKRPSEREIRTASFESREMSPGPSHSPLMKKLGLECTSAPGGGVLVSDVASDSPSAGKLLRGDRIVEVNGIRIGALSDFTTALHKRSKHIVFVVQRQGRRLFVAVPRP